MNESIATKVIGVLPVLGQLFDLIYREVFLLKLFHLKLCEFHALFMNTHKTIQRCSKLFFLLCIEIKVTFRFSLL